jgi:hypothetical protein
MGITGTYGIGTYDGYPLSVDALNDPNGEQSTGPSFASNFNWWFGGAPRDWLSTGLGFSALSAQFNRATGVGIGLLLHVEAFPFYSLGGLYRDLGIGLDGGLGVVTMFDADDKEFEEPIAESGSLSTIAVSAFWEPIRLWNVSMGPAANYVHGFSQTMHINQFTVGWRTSLYGVQPKKKKRAGS